MKEIKIRCSIIIAKQQQNTFHFISLKTEQEAKHVACCKRTQFYVSQHKEKKTTPKKRRGKACDLEYNKYRTKIV